MAEPTSEPKDYIRGAIPAAVDRRRVLRVLAASIVVGIAVLAVVLAIGGVRENDRLTNLKHRGVPVDVTVLSCVARASGTGITAAGFTCRGSFVLAGTKHVARIGGTDGQYRTGDTIAAVADPRDPSALQSADAVRTARATWHQFVLPEILTCFVLAGLVVLIRDVRRNR